MTQNESGAQLLTTAQAAAQLHISRRALLYRIAKGQMAAVKIGDGATSAYLIAADEVARHKAAS